MTNIWRDGFKIVRDAIEIELTSKEISEIYHQIQVCNGRGSIEYYLDNDDLEDEKIAAAEKLMEDDNACADIWDEYLECVFFDSGEDELNVVDDFVQRELDKEVE